MAKRVEIEPISSLKRASEIIERVKTTRSPLYITQNGKAAAVIQDVESYEAREEAIAMLKLCLGGEQSIAEGRSKTLSAFRKSLRGRVLERAQELGLGRDK